MPWPEPGEIIDAGYAAPQEDGGKLGLTPDIQFIRNAERMIEWLGGTQIREGSAAFATSLTRQVIPALWPDHRQRDKVYELRKHRNTAVRHLNFIQAAGYLHWEPARDETDAWWRTHIWLLDKAAGETWRFSNESANEASAEAERAAIREAILGSLDGTSGDPQRALFSDHLQLPSRDNSATTRSAVVISSHSVKSSARAHEENDFSRREQALREARRLAAPLARSHSRARWSGLPALEEALHAGASPLSVVLAAYMLLFDGSPRLSRLRWSQLERSLDQVERVTGSNEEGTRWLLSAMGDYAHVVDQDRRHGSSQHARPRSMNFFVAPFRKVARSMRREWRRRRKDGTC